MMRFRPKTIILLSAVSAFFATQAHADPILVEAESFSNLGGWVLDTQFIETMGSPYIMAHGLGTPVADAVTEVNFPSAGTWHVWVRTKDWVAPWAAPGTPGRFKVTINDVVLPETFGTVGAEWHWQKGGAITLTSPRATVKLNDLTGFNGRADALLFSQKSDWDPNKEPSTGMAWRRALVGAPPHEEKAGYDFVVIGGGYAGTSAAIAAARAGIKVALVQNRDVLGGNGSSEIRVWAKGNTPSRMYPIGDIVNEISDRASLSPGTAEEFGDDIKDSIVRAEKNIDLFLGHHAYGVEMNNGKIAGIKVFDVRSGAAKIFRGHTYADCTGHGFIGLWAGAEYTMTPKGRLGMSNMWRWRNESSVQTFPKIEWGLDIEQSDFPYPKKFHAEWFWESGYDKHPINEKELIRDWNLRANFGAWNAMKNKGAYANNDPNKLAHQHARLEWMAYVGGTRETLQILGDVLLTVEEIIQKKPYPDACVLTTWNIDLHYPRKEYMTKYPDNPYIAYANHGPGVDPQVGYPIPYRTFYSRNIPNLFIAGRNISVTREALGTVRVMKTGGMMGVVVGKAAAICAKHNSTPRDVYEKHWDEMVELMNLPGKAFRPTLNDPFTVPQGVATATPGNQGFPIASIPGMVIDTDKAEIKGTWTRSTHTIGFVGENYLHDANEGKGKKSVRFPITVPESGLYKLNISYRAGGGRASNIPVQITHSLGTTKVVNDQTLLPTLDFGFYPLGEFMFDKAKPGSVEISNEGTNGFVIVDAIQLVKQP